MPPDPAQPAAPPAAAPGPNAVDKLHTHAMEAEKHVEQLATGLGQVGADPQAVKAVTQMADVLRRIAKGLAKGGTQQPEQPRETMDSAADQMMADHRARMNGGNPNA